MEIEDPEARKEIIFDVVKATLRPELYNRISQVVSFNALTALELERIVTQHLDRLKNKLADEREIEMSSSAAAIQELAKLSYDPAYGARPVGRTIQQLVLSPLALALLSGEINGALNLRSIFPKKRALPSMLLHKPLPWRKAIAAAILSSICARGHLAAARGGSARRLDRAV
jgi:ATP-dependent Clp protease ATP-binding subunit ClpB